MHLRRYPWMREELEASSWFVQDPWEHIGAWRDLYTNPERELHLELGCGKGGFISQAALENPEVNYLGIDMTDVVLARSRRNVDARQVKNVRLTAWDIERIDKILNEEDRIDRLYINFCNPWPKRKHHKKRLTHPRQLELYRKFLKPEAEIYFRTDDEQLFDDSINYFLSNNFEILEINRDLPEGKWITTEHEKMFRQANIPIKILIAKSKDNNF